MSRYLRFGDPDWNGGLRPLNKDTNPTQGRQQGLFEHLFADRFVLEFDTKGTSRFRQ